MAHASVRGTPRRRSPDHAKYVRLHDIKKKNVRLPARRAPPLEAAAGPARGGVERAAPTTKRRPPARNGMALAGRRRRSIGEPPVVFGRKTWERSAVCALKALRAALIRHAARRTADHHRGTSQLQRAGPGPGRDGEKRGVRAWRTCQVPT